jgi:hypothetical protein
MYLLWVIFQSRYIESPAGPGHKALVFTSTDGGNGECAGIHQISFVAIIMARITGDGFLVEGKAGGIFTCFHSISRLNFF